MPLHYYITLMPVLEMLAKFSSDKLKLSRSIESMSFATKYKELETKQLILR